MLLLLKIIQLRMIDPTFRTAWIDPYSNRPGSAHTPSGVWTVIWRLFKSSEI